MQISIVRVNKFSRITIMMVVFYRSVNWSHRYYRYHRNPYIAGIISILIPVLICCCLGNGVFASISLV